jgi:hydroxymethylpyrimidine pyrophosphatase-like HAD family hydrolase
VRYHALATDYDGTLATDGRVSVDTANAIRALRKSGRRALMVTGRQIEELLAICPEVELFDRVVAENGAVMYSPETGVARALAEPPPPQLVPRLRSLGVEPLSVGRVIVATERPYEVVALEVIQQLGLELQVIFNKGSVMLLPSGVNKATGLAAALAELGLSPHEVVAIGDAENDHALLASCGCAVAVANAVPSLKQHADLVTTAEAGAGVCELVARLLTSDLAELGVSGRPVATRVSSG